MSERLGDLDAAVLILQRYGATLAVAGHADCRGSHHILLFPRARGRQRLPDQRGGVDAW
jgi:hypothetical protein